jgi:hypothetical protein
VIRERIHVGRLAGRVREDESGVHVQLRMSERLVNMQPCAVACQQGLSTRTTYPYPARSSIEHGAYNSDRKKPVSCSCVSSVSIIWRTRES